MQSITTRTVENFGRNLRLTPQAIYEPAGVSELLEILDRHASQTIKAIGSLHSWSPVAQSQDVIVSLKNFTNIELCSANRQVAEESEANGRAQSAWIGAGIQIKDLIVQLEHLGLSLPSLGLITEQTIAGATATGTHGSGRHCLSHYVQAIKLACYDRHGKATIETIDSGDLLQAAQCALGNLGIVVAVRVTLRERYNIAELWRAYASLDQVLNAQAEFPLQQFFLLPWKWSFLAQHRRETNEKNRGPHWLYRLYFFLAIDIGLHLILLSAGKILNSKRLVQFLFRKFLWRSIIPNWLVVGPAYKMLVMEHEIFRHIETELFVTADRLVEALTFLEHSLTYAAGNNDDLPADYLALVAQTGLSPEFRAIRGIYCHHYPICVRRILPDQTLISMTNGGHQDWYSISLISYHQIRHRDGFFRTMEFLSRAMAKLFDARPHWGKHNPVPPDELIRLYPEFHRFAELCYSRDPNGAFRNEWFRRFFDTSLHKHLGG